MRIRRGFVLAAAVLTSALVLAGCARDTGTARGGRRRRRHRRAGVHPQPGAGGRRRRRGHPGARRPRTPTPAR